jgi:hypothetical protein
MIIITDDEVAVPTTVRLERPLRIKLEDAAKSSFRPLSREIAYRLAASFQCQDDKAATAS